MQRRTRPFSILPIAIAIAAGLSGAPAAHAAELGDARVSSHIGQQLVADIELTMLEDAHAPVQVRLADPEVYSGAGIALPAALSTLNLSVMRRDGRQFLHATTLRPVDADHLHLYVELIDHGQRVVRLATLWLTPDPNPAPVSAPAPAPAPAAVPVPVSGPAPVHAAAAVLAQAGAPARVRASARARGEGETALGLPAPSAPSSPAVYLARHSRPAEAPAPTSDALPAARSGPASASASRPAPAPAPARASEAAPVRPPHSPFALPLPSHRAGPAACAPQDGDAQSCAALGTRNAELRTRIGQLEERVKGLQARLGVAADGQVAVPAAAAAPAAAATAATAATAAVKTAKPETHDADAADAHPAPPQPAGHAAPSNAAPPPEPKPEPKSEAKPESKPEAKPAAPPGPKPISSIKPLVPHKSKTPPPDDDLPLGAIGAGLALLALAGGAAALLKARAKRARNVDIPAEPGLLDKLRRRFGKHAGARPAAASRVEPVDNAVAEPSLE